jgi:hypothetical protein
MHDPWSVLHVAVLVGAGCAAGFVNTAAGAGSLVSLRALMLLGVPADVANGTNRLPVLAQSIAAALGFYSKGSLDRKAIVRIAVPTSIGAVFGALAASRLPEHEMRYVLIFVLFVMGLVSLKKTKPKVRPAKPLGDSAVAGVAPADAPADAPVEPSASGFGFFAALVFAGMYGGFLQAGVGLVLLFALSTIGGYDMVRANALKVVVVGIFTVAALAVFMWSGKVDYVAGAIMSVGSVIGARLAVAYAMGHAEKLKRFAVAVDAIACVALLYREWAG